MPELSEYRECHEEVSRGGELQPCEKPAVALRLDLPDGGEYPVCAHHSRGDMVPLARIVADARAEALQEAADALNVDGVAFRPGWGSGNEGDQGALDVLGKSIAWLRDRADREAATESKHADA